MDIFFIQYLAIYNNEHLPIKIIIGPRRLKLLPTTKITLQKIAKDFIIFAQNGEISPNLVTLTTCQKKWSCSQNLGRPVGRQKNYISTCFSLNLDWLQGCCWSCRSRRERTNLDSDLAGNWFRGLNISVTRFGESLTLWCEQFDVSGHTAKRSQNATVLERFILTETFFRWIVISSKK